MKFRSYNIKNTNIRFIFLKFNYKYNLYIFYKNNINYYFKFIFLKESNLII